MKFWNWLVKSSVNPEKTALTIKGLSAFVPSAVAFTLLIGHPVTSGDLNGLLTSIAGIVTGLLSALSAGIALYGFGRKIYLTLF